MCDKLFEASTQAKLLAGELRGVLVLPTTHGGLSWRTLNGFAM